MKIGISTIAYNTGGFTRRQIDSVLKYTKHEVIFYLFLHNSRYQELIDECNKVVEDYNGQIRYFPYGINRGYSCSSNEGIHIGYIDDRCDIFILGSQDVWFNTPSAFDDWITKCVPYLNSKYVLTTAENPPPKIAPFPFAFWLLTPLGLETVGYLDENFFPAQYEDIDYNRRCDFLSVGYARPHYESFWSNAYRVDLPSDSTHFGMLCRQDSHLNFQQNYITAPLCHQYYLRKWGGEPEIFTHPFNNIQLSHNIIWDKHSTPYGQPYDRTDHYIVQV